MTNNNEQLKSTSIDKENEAELVVRKVFIIIAYTVSKKGTDVSER